MYPICWWMMIFLQESNKILIDRVIAGVNGRLIIELIYLCF